MLECVYIMCSYNMHTTQPLASRERRSFWTLRKNACLFLSILVYTHEKMSWLNLLGDAAASTCLLQNLANAGNSIADRTSSNDDTELKRTAEAKSNRNSENIPSMLDWFFAMVITSDISSSEFNEEDQEPDNSLVIPPGQELLLDQYYQDLFRADEFGFITSFDDPDSTTNASSTPSLEKSFTNKSAFADTDLPGIRIDSPSPNFGFYVEMTPPTSPKKACRIQEEFYFAMSEEEGTEVDVEVGKWGRRRGTLTPLASRVCATAGAGTGGEMSEVGEAIVRWWDYFIL
jgi:hypothetical protein